MIQLTFLGVFVTYNSEQLIEMNYNPLIKRCQNILDLWHHRGLTLFGRILVLNSLISSIFVYRMTVLRIMPRSMLKELKNIFLKFVWGSKVAKVKWEVLVASKTDGGAGLVNMEKKDEILKIDWLFKAIKQQKIRTLAYELLQNPIGDLIWEISLDPTDLKYLCNIESFWLDVMRTWLKVRKVELKTERDIRKEVIWFNSQIKVGGRLVCYLDWFEKGISQINDIIDEQGNMLSHENLQWKTGLTIPLLVYYGIKSAIPRKWWK